MLKTLICPVSKEHVNIYLIRFTSFIISACMIIFILTSNYYIGLIVPIDYFIRGFTKLKYSPFSWLSYKIIQLLNLGGTHMPKAPKIFAARVGFICSFSAVVLTPINESLGLAAGIILISFNFLEWMLNICVGCLMYTYIILPLSFGRK